MAELIVVGITDEGWLYVECPDCQGTCKLPGKNWVAQGSVSPSCWHCSGGKRLATAEEQAYLVELEA